MTPLPGDMVRVTRSGAFPEQAGRTGLVVGCRFCPGRSDLDEVEVDFGDGHGRFTFGLDEVEPVVMVGHRVVGLVVGAPLRPRTGRVVNGAKAFAWFLLALNVIGVIEALTGGPTWLGCLCGAGAMGMFDQLVDLYTGVL